MFPQVPCPMAPSRADHSLPLILAYPAGGAEAWMPLPSVMRLPMIVASRPTRPLRLLRLRMSPLARLRSPRPVLKQSLRMMRLVIQPVRPGTQTLQQYPRGPASRQHQYKTFLLFLAVRVVSPVTVMLIPRCSMCRTASRLRQELRQRLVQILSQPLGRMLGLGLILVRVRTLVLLVPSSFRVKRSRPWVWVLLTPKRAQVSLIQPVRLQVTCRVPERKVRREFLLLTSVGIPVTALRVPPLLCLVRVRLIWFLILGLTTTQVSSTVLVLLSVAQVVSLEIHRIPPLPSLARTPKPVQQQLILLKTYLLPLHLRLKLRPNIKRWLVMAMSTRRWRRQCNVRPNSLWSQQWKQPLKPPRN
eukprot:Rmarinus@m.20589